MQSSASKKKFSLQFHITTLFTTLIIICGLSLGSYSYSLLSQNILKEGQRLFNNSSIKVIQKISSDNERISTILRILRATNLTELTSEKSKIGSLPVLFEMLNSTKRLSALFIAYANNDFFLYKKIPSTAVLNKYNAPKNSYFMMTLRQSNKTHHHFFDIENKRLKVVEDPNYNIKIAERPWYQKAKNSDHYIVTDPYVFHASQELGVTLAVEDKRNGAVLGADYTLNGLSNLLKEFQAYSTDQRIIVNQHGQVIAYQDAEKLFSAGNKFDSFKTIESLNTPVLEHVFNHYKDQKGIISFTFNNEDWRGEVSAVSANRHLLLLQVVNTKDLLSEAYKLLDQSVFITLLIILATLPIAWYFARLLTAPMSVLSKDLEKIKDFDFRKTKHHKTSVKEISELLSVTNQMKDTISHFLDLSASLVSKQSFQQLLSKISEECNNIPNSQGTIIIINNKNNCEIKHCHLPELSHSMNTQLLQQLAAVSLDCDMLQADITNRTIPDEIQQLLQKNRILKHTLNWRLVALKNRSGKNLGAIAVLESQQLALNKGKLRYAQAIASFSALSIQSQQLLTEQKQLLESFILLIAGAIDSKSPYTGGHCARVPELTKMLSKAACDDKQGHYKNFDLTEDQWEELHIAAWLHDCGKIVTPEYIVDKATKLETIYDRLNEIRMRFELLKSETEKNYWQAVAEKGDKQQLILQRDALLTQLDREFEFIAECNIGGEFMSDDKINQLQMIAKRTWNRTLNNKIGIAPHQANKIADSTLPIKEPLLADKAEHLIEREHKELTEVDNEWGFEMQTPEYRFNRGELYNLSIKRGTLTTEDRFIINGHMVHTIVMLSKLPFPDHLQQVPTIAGGHHEKMDGTGYPRKINASELPTTARIMVIADIFEALTASDRPYKERKSLSQSLKIMSFMVKDNHIDADLFKLFLTSGVYLQYAQHYLLADQIDEIDISQYL